MKLNEKEKKIIIDFFELLFEKTSLKKASTKAEKSPSFQETKSRLIPLVKWNEYHPYPSVGTLRWYRYNDHKNDFRKCVRKEGKRLYIDEKTFFEWMNEQTT